MELVVYIKESKLHVLTGWRHSETGSSIGCVSLGIAGERLCEIVRVHGHP